MASLIEKLGSTISGKVSSSISGFGAGAKSAFIGANPAAFGPVASALSKGFASLGQSQARIAKDQVNAEKEKRGVQEEKDREDRKVFVDIQSTLNIISDDVKKILDILTKNASEDTGSALKTALAAAAGSGAGALSKGLLKVVDEIVGAIKKLPGLLADLFKFLKNLPDFFKAFRGKFATALDDLLKFLKNSFPKAFSALGDLGKTLRNLFKSFKFDDLAKAISASLNNLKKFFKFDDILDFFKSIPAKFKSIFKLDDLGKQFRSLRNTVLVTIGYIADKFDDILSSVRSNKAFATISDLVGDFVKVIGALITDSSNIIKGAAAGILGKSVLPTKLPGKPTTALPASIGDLGKAAAAMMEGKAAAGAVEAIPDVVKAADAVGDVGQAAKNVGILGKLLSAFSGFGNLASGPLRFLGELTDVTAFVGTIAKVLGPIGVIFSIFDGISTATDTAKLQSIFGKFDITMQDRISGFVGGFIGGFGGLFDLLAKLMGIEIEGESIQSSLTKTVTLMTDSIFEGIKSFLQFIGKILTSEPAKAVFGAAKELIGAVADGIGAMFGFMKDVFFSEGFQKVITVLTQIAGSAISGVIDAVKSVVEIVVGLFTLDFTKVKSAVGDLVGTVVTGIQSALAMIGNGIIWAINGLMDTLSLPSSWRMSYFDVPGVKGGNMFAGGDQTAATANRTGVNLTSTAGAGRGADPRSAANMPSVAEQAAAMSATSPTSYIRFTGNTGSEENFKLLSPEVKDAVLLAAKDYYDTTGKKLQINSAFRTAEDQARIAGTAKYLVAQPGKSRHESGQAVDIQNYNDPKALAALQKYGLVQRYGSKDPMHFEMGTTKTASAPISRPDTVPAEEKREAAKTVEAVQTTATETVAIRRANEDQSETLSSLASDFENSTEIQQAQLDNLDAYQKENRAEAQRQTELLKKTATALSPEQQQRKNLETQFLSQVESDIRGAITKALGPAGMGVSGQNANMMAYRTYGS